MSYAPAPLRHLQAYMQAQTGLPAVSLGVVGGPGHDGGYHCGWDRRRFRGGQLADYSWEESARDWSHKTEAASAFDIGSHKDLRQLSLWIVEQCRANTIDTRDIREVIYSPDGRTVRRWDRLGIRATGDDSHLTHTHISWHRDAENRDKLALFKRYYEGDEDNNVALTNEDLDRIAERVWSRENPSADQTYSQILRGAARRIDVAEIRATLSAIAGNDPAAVVREEFAKLTTLLVETLRQEIIHNGPITDDQLERILRRVLGSVDDDMEGPVT